MAAVCTAGLYSSLGVKLEMRLISSAQHRTCSKWHATYTTARWHDARGRRSLKTERGGRAGGTGVQIEAVSKSVCVASALVRAESVVGGALWLPRRKRKRSDRINPPGYKPRSASHAHPFATELIGFGIPLLLDAV